PPARVRVVELPDLPDGGDIVDFRPGVPPERIRAEVEALAAAAAPVEAADAQGGEPEAPGPLPRYVTAAALARAKPRLRPPVVHGLLREGETLNIIAPSKTGKSWLALSLAASVASGRPWLGAFETEPGPVLIIDNELHEETIARRVPQVIEALCLPPDTAELVYVESLRGRLVNLHAMRHYFGAIEPRLFRVVVLDAFYRFLPAGISENDNGALAGLFNAMDAHAARLGCAFVCIHHSTKGSQAAKAVVDVGSGAGAMARAADSHCILRAHEEPGAFVLEAVARSWPPPEALALRWTWPTFTPASDLSPLDLKPERTRRQRAPREEKPPKPTMDVATFAAECVGNGDGVVSATAMGRAVDKGLSQAAAGLLLKRAEAEGYIRRVVSGPCAAHTFVLAEGGGRGIAAPTPGASAPGGCGGAHEPPSPPCLSNVGG
ncbi:MAG: AAA family ATPase, partial [Phycisphaerae bacterium]|nr:AAA family ATPase [Phycisphaerae bacterium]